MGVELTEIVSLKQLTKLKSKIGVKLPVRGRFHHSPRRIKKLKNEKLDDLGVADYKPNGLWYSLGDSWLRFLEQESSYFSWSLHRIDSYKFVYRVTVDPRKILRLNTPEDFEKFTDRFGVVLPSRGREGNFLINWQEVFVYHHGIEVRGCDDWMGKWLWFDGWDCASGCIWDSSAIKKLELVAEY